MTRLRRLWIAVIVLAMLFEPLALAQSQQGGNPQPPPIVVIGGSGSGGGAGGSGGGAGGAGGGSGGGGLYDGYTDIRWNGPSVLPNAPLIFEPFPVNDLLDRFRAATAHLPGSVRKEDLTYDQALFNINGLIPRPGLEMIEQLKAESRTAAIAGNHIDNYAVAAGMASRLDTMLALTLARHAATPQDPTHLLNLAGLLTQRGLVNEAVAMLDRLRASASTPEMAFGFKPAAAIGYLDGYTSLLRGELQKAQSLLRASFSADRSIADASLALSAAVQAMGGDGRKEFIEGFLQAYGGGEFMYCGDKWAEDPLTTDEEQHVGPPADQLFDLSKGIDGVLPQLTHPGSGQRLAVMLEELPEKQQAIQTEILAHDARATAIHGKLSARMQVPNPEFSDLTNQSLMDLINDANACLKPLHRMKEQVDEVAEDMSETIQGSAELIMPQLMKAGEIEDSERRRAVARQLVADGMGHRVAAIQGWDAAVRIRFKSWHKYATALAQHMSDPDWQEYAKETILVAAKTEWAGLYVGVVANYGAYLPAATQLYGPDTPPPVPSVVPSPFPLCNPQTQKGSVEIDHVKVPAQVLPVPRPQIGVSMEFNCDKIAVEMDGMVGIGHDDIARIAAGGFAEASKNRGGDVTVFGGPKIAGSIAGQTGSVKDGVYVTFDSDGIKEVGTRIEAAQRAGVLKLQTFEKGFVIWAAPPRPPRFDPQTGMSIWRSVK